MSKCLGKSISSYSNQFSQQYNQVYVNTHVTGDSNHSNIHFQPGTDLMVEMYFVIFMIPSNHTVFIYLQRAYNERGDIFSFQLMVLPFLLSEHIVQVFQHLEQRARCNLLPTIMNYIWQQWITNLVFPVKTWGVFMISVRTNNDIDG